MKQYITEERAIYEDEYHGQFSKKLAQWAIRNMEKKDAGTGRVSSIQVRPLDDVIDILNVNGLKLPDKCTYTAWYLFHMAIADYPKSLKTDELRAHFVYETICDPDGDPSNVLACFEAKMCNMGVPIYWERMM